MPSTSRPLAPRLAALLACTLLAVLAAAKPTKWINSFAGPYILNIEKIYMCDESQMDTSMGSVSVHLRISHWNPMRPNDLQILNGNLSLVNTTINDNGWVVINLAIRSNNMWKENALVIRTPGGGCSFVRTNLPGVWNAFFSLPTKSPGPCIVPEGDYVMRNASVDWSAPNIPVLPYGYYRVHMWGGPYGLENKLPAMCIFGEAHIVPKAS